MAVLFCGDCACEREAVPIYKAMALVGVSRATIYRWIERGWVHGVQLPSGRQMICRDSLVSHAGTNCFRGSGVGSF
jgi:predicted site-specific integrase-resolvase